MKQGQQKLDFGQWTMLFLPGSLGLGKIKK